MKIPGKRELQQITHNHSSDTESEDFMRLYKDYTKEPFSFLVNDAPLPSDNPLRYRKNLLVNKCQRENQNNRSQNRTRQSSIQFR